MTWFQKEKTSIGIDFGTSSIKVVELALRDQKIHLVNYGSTQVVSSLDDRDYKAQSYQQKLSLHLQELLKRMNVKGDECFVALPSFSGLVTLVEFPQMSEKQLSEAVQFEAHKYVPASLDEIALSYDVVFKNREKTRNSSQGSKTLSGFLKKDVSKLLTDKATNASSHKDETMHVLLVAAPKKEVRRYEDLIATTPLDLKALELEVFSLTRSLVGDNDKVFILIDMGYRATNILLIDSGVVRISRNIDIGGSEITRAIAESLNVSPERAETYKNSTRDFLNAKESSVQFPAFDMIVSEVRRVIDAYKQKNNTLAISGVILSGGAAHMTGLPVYLEKLLNITVVHGDPWSRITYDVALEPFIKKMGSSYSVAIGLALRGFNQ